jgi:hypothetical protein
MEQRERSELRLAVNVSIMRVRTTLSGWNGGPGLMTFYYTFSGGTPTNAEATEAAARVRAFLQAMRSNFPAILTAQVSGAVDDVDAATGSLVGGATGTTPAAVTGGGTVSLNDPHSQALLGLQTSLVIGGRRVKGHTFLGPLDSGVVSAGLLASTSASGILTAAASLTTLISTAIGLVVWHRPKGTPHVGGQAVPVTGFTCPTKLAVLRSRRD